MSAWVVTMGAGATMGSCIRRLPFHPKERLGPQSITWASEMAKHNSGVRKESTCIFWEGVGRGEVGSEVAGVEGRTGGGVWHTASCHKVIACMMTNSQAESGLKDPIEREVNLLMF